MARTRKKKNAEEKSSREHLDKNVKLRRTDAFKKVTRQVNREREKTNSSRNPEIKNFNLTVSQEVSKIKKATRTLSSINKKIEGQLKNIKKEKKKLGEEPEESFKLCEILLSNQKETINILKEVQVKFTKTRFELFEHIKNNNSLIFNIIDQFDRVLHSDEMYPQDAINSNPSERSKKMNEISKSERLCLENENSIKESMFFKFPNPEEV